MNKVDVFDALASPVRRQILMRLRHGPRPAGELCKGFRIGRPAVSEHLQVLRRARLVREERRGRQRYYQVDPRPLSQVEAWVTAFTRYWKKRMVALGEVLDQEAGR